MTLQNVPEEVQRRAMEALQSVLLELPQYGEAGITLCMHDGRIARIRKLKEEQLK